MGVIQEQFRLPQLRFQDETASDFYVSCWLRSRTALPLLCLRLVLFLGCVGIVLSSLLIPEKIVHAAYWPIYMTHWGLTMVTVTYGLATAVSAAAYFKGPIDSTFGLPWYIRLFWGCYCIAVPISFLVTIFYYSFVMNAALESEDHYVDPVLDVFTHGINSVLTFVLLMTSRLPLYFGQIVYPLCFLIVYSLFTLIYYFAGGTNQYGDRFIYPVVDWSQPGMAVGALAIAGGLVVGGYIVACLMTLLRNRLTRRFNTTTMDVSD